MISDKARAAVWLALLLLAFPIAVLGDVILIAYEKSLARRTIAGVESSVLQESLDKSTAVWLSVEE